MTAARACLALLLLVQVSVSGWSAAALPIQSDIENSPYVVMRYAEDFLDGNDRDRTRAHVRRLGLRLRTITLPEAQRSGDPANPSRIYELLAHLNALEGNFSGSLEDFRAAEAAYRREQDLTSALDMRRGQATALALAGRFEEALALDEGTSFCPPGETCSTNGVIDACREVTARIQGGRAFWNYGFETMGPRSLCAAEASLEIARLAERQGRNELVEPFLALSVFASWGSRYGSARAAADVRRMASSTLLLRMSDSGRGQQAQRLLARLGGDAAQGAPAGGPSEAPPALTVRRGGLELVQAGIRKNVESFVRLARTYGYMDAGPSRPFQGADQMFDLTRMLAIQHIQIDDLKSAVGWSDLALRYASRAVAPYYPLRTDFGAPIPQCPPGRSAEQECRAWETEAIEAYSSTQIAGVLAERAELEGRRGDYAELVAVSDLSERVMANWLSMNWTSAKDVADQFVVQRQQDEETLRQLGEARRAAPTLRDSAARLAFVIAQRLQFGEIDAGVRDARIRSQVEQPATAFAWQERQDLVRELSVLERGTRAFAQTSAAIAAAEARLPFSPTELERETGFHSVPAEAVRRNLASDEVAIIIVPLQYRTEVFLVTSNGFDWRTSAQSAEWIEARVDRLRDHLNGARGARSGFSRTAAFELYRELLGPFEQVIGQRRILVSASGALDRLPLSVLVTQAPSGSDVDPDALRGTAWLGLRNSVVVVPSLSLIEARSTARRAQRAGLVAFADPALPDAELAIVEERGTGSLGRLAGAAREVDALKKASMGRISVFIGEAATERAVRQSDFANVGVIAFATHGLAAGQWRPDSEPGLMLTPGPNAADERNDGFLSASEAAELPISADIVLLSACDTASSRALGGQSLTGLALSFLFAGGRTVMATHWPVADEAASSIVAGAVGRAEQRTAAGLADALKVELRRLVIDSARISDADPRYWAPFIVIGA